MFGILIVCEEPEVNVIPSTPQLGLFTRVPLKVPNPPKLYTVVPVPAFCDERRGQQTILLQRPRSFMPVTKREICCRPATLVTPAVVK